MRGDSPRGGDMSQSDRGDRALFALDAKRPEGWFPVQNLAISLADLAMPRNAQDRSLQNQYQNKHKHHPAAGIYLPNGGVVLHLQFI